MDTHHAQAAHCQKSQYDRHAQSRELCVGDLVWLSCPRAGKLDARWEGGWKIKKVIGSSNYEIEDSKVSQIVIANRLRLRIQPDHSIPQDRECGEPMWQPPSAQHETLFTDPPTRQLQSPSVQPEIPFDQTISSTRAETITTIDNDANIKCSRRSLFREGRM